MKTFAQIAEDIAPLIKEMMPWDLDERGYVFGDLGKGFHGNSDI